MDQGCHTCLHSDVNTEHQHICASGPLLYPTGLALSHGILWSPPVCASPCENGVHSEVYTTSSAKKCAKHCQATARIRQSCAHADSPPQERAAAEAEHCCLDVQDFKVSSASENKQAGRDCATDEKALVGCPSSSTHGKREAAVALWGGAAQDNAYFFAELSKDARFSSKESEFKYSLLGAPAIVSAISRAASILRSAMNAGFDCTACPISLAASASPFARTIVDFFSCSARVTINRARSASCCATCRSVDHCAWLLISDASVTKDNTTSPLT